MSVSYHYESVGNSSYLVATVAQGQGIVNFELQMLTNNTIKNLLQVSRRQKNDDVCLFYNVTSKMSLAQVTSKKKISKKGFIQLLNGALNAVEEAGEYQLTSSGFVFSPEYIFVQPGSFDPSFVYMPTAVEEKGIEPLKRFLMDLIFKSMVEVTNDNFVQVVLEAINDPAVSIKSLRTLCEKYSNPVEPEPMPGPAPIPNPKPVPEPLPVPEPTPVPKPIPGSLHSDIPIPGPMPIKPIEHTPNHDKKEHKPNGNGKKELSPKKIIFIVMQAVFVGAIAFLALSGVLSNSEGKLNIQYIAGILIAVAGVDFIVYREMFVNSKGGKNGEGEKAQAVKTERATEKAKPQPYFPSKPAAAPPTPAPYTPPTAPNAYAPQTPQPSAQFARDYRKAEVKPLVEDDNSDSTVIDDLPSGAYLEYFENGLSTRFILDKDSSLVGRMKSQCDFTLANNKISKVHAEFIRRGGEYFVKDYNSANGTYINESSQRISANTEYPIHNGDKITLANSELIFRC